MLPVDDPDYTRVMNYLWDLLDRRGELKSIEQSGLIDGQTAFARFSGPVRQPPAGPSPVPVLGNPDAALRITWYPFGIRLNRPGPKSGLKTRIIHEHA